jgi:hypothetical protein
MLMQHDVPGENNEGLISIMKQPFKWHHDITSSNHSTMHAVEILLRETSRDSCAVKSSQHASKLAEFADYQNYEKSIKLKHSDL